MFNIYLTNWIDERLQNNPMISSEQLIMSIPFSEGEEPCMINPTIKEEMGKAPSLDFTVNPGMKYYNAYQKLLTIVRVDYVDSSRNYTNTIFYGHVKTINTSNLLAIKSIHVEGLYSILADSPFEGLEEELQVNKTAEQLFNEIIANHNSYIAGDDWKHISETYIEPGILDGESKKRSPTSWTDSLSALDQLIDNYGGYMRMRHINSGLKLEWFKHYYRDLGNNVRPYFQLSKNIIDLSSSDEIDEIFTRMIPVGHKAYTESSSTSSKKETSYIYLSPKYIRVRDVSISQQELSANFQSADEFVHAEDYYGRIYKTVSFQNADTVDKLQSYAIDWIKKNYFGALRSFTVKAVDMKMIGANDNTNDMILAGDCIDISYPVFDQNGNRSMTPKTRLVCKSAQIVLFNPEQNVYTIGIPNSAIDFEYGQKSKKKKASATATSADQPVSAPATKPKTITWTAVRNFLLRFYYSYNWVTYEEAAKAHAISWRSGGINTRTDKLPYATFDANKPLKATLDYADGIPLGLTMDDVQTILDSSDEPDKVIKNGWTYNKLNAWYDSIETTYPTRNFVYNGKQYKNASVLGWYRTSAVNDKIKSYIAATNSNHPNGYEYGVGAYNGQAFAFTWSQYFATSPNNSNPITIEFFFPESLRGSSMDDDVSNLIDSDGAADNTTAEPSSWINPETGEVKVEIFPDLGTVGAGYAYEFNEDGTIKIDPATGEPVVLKDQDGHPVWAISLNDPITYYDEQGNPHTIPSGVMVANDLSLPNIPSFKTEMAAIHTLIAANATIAQLRAITADIGNYDDVSDADFNTLFEVDYHYTDSSGNVVLPFSTKKSYQVGDRVGYNNKIYQFTSEHSPGTWNSSQVVLIGDGTKVDNVDANGNKILKVKEGTRFANTTNQVQGVAGRFILNSDGSMSIMEGGGIDIKRGNASFGLWDEGKLSAGMFVTKDNGKTYTKIKGDYINIGDGNSEINLKETMSVSSQGTAVFHKPILLDGHQLIIKGSGNNADSQTNVSGTGITLSGIGTITWPGQGPSGGAPAVSGGTLDREKVVNLINTSSVHVKITGPVSNKYTLWYLPASKSYDGSSDPSTDAGWINAGSFSRAASIKPIWSGSGAEGATGVHLKLLAHPAGDENTELDKFLLGFGENYNPTSDYGTVQIQPQSLTYDDATGILTVPYKISLMTLLEGDEEPKAMKILYTNNIDIAKNDIPITTEPTVSFTKTDADKLGAISGKATDVFGNVSSSITFSVSRPTGTFQDQTGSGATHRVMEFKYGSDVVGRYQVDDYWNGGGNSAYASSPTVVASPTNEERTAAGSALSLNTYYKYDVKYTNAAGDASSAVDTKYFLTPSETHSVSISDQRDTSSKQELQNIYGSTATLNTAFSSEQLNKNSRFYGFKVTCGTSSKYYYFQTPSATETIVTVGDWANYRLGWNASRNMIKRSGNSILRGKEMQAGATSAPTGYDTYTIASASISGGSGSSVGYIATKSMGYPGDGSLGYWIDAGDTRRWSLASGYYLHLKHFGSSSGTGIVNWTV